MTALTLFMTLNAHAAPGALTTLVEPVLNAEEGTWLENGPGAPTVAYDPIAGEYVMYFEVNLPDAFYAHRPGCASSGYDFDWGIGRATSPDGVTWTADSEPVLLPVEDTYYACVLSNPAVVYDGETWRLWFRAHGLEEGCDVEVDVNCLSNTGIGLATSTDGVNFTSSEEPVIEPPTAYFASVAKVEDTWTMLVQSDADGDLHLGTSPDGEEWTFDSTDPVIGGGDADWITDWNHGDLICNDTGDSDTLTSLILSYEYGTDTYRWGVVTSDGATWTPAEEATYEWEPGDSGIWTHSATMRVGDEYLLYHRVQGTSSLFLSFTSPNWNVQDISPNICPPPESWTSACQPTVNSCPDDGGGGFPGGGFPGGGGPGGGDGGFPGGGFPGG